MHAPSRMHTYLHMCMHEMITSCGPNNTYKTKVYGACNNNQLLYWTEHTEAKSAADQNAN